MCRIPFGSAPLWRAVHLHFLLLCDPKRQASSFELHFACRLLPWVVIFLKITMGQISDKHKLQGKGRILNFENNIEKFCFGKKTMENFEATGNLSQTALNCVVCGAIPVMVTFLTTSLQFAILRPWTPFIRMVGKLWGGGFQHGGRVQAPPSTSKLWAKKPGKSRKNGCSAGGCRMGC